ncbi:hypothetical protein D3C75_1322940 [compost metagenome]
MSEKVKGITVSLRKISAAMNSAPYPFRLKSPSYSSDNSKIWPVFRIISRVSGRKL